MTAPSTPTTTPTARTAQWASDHANDYAVCALPVGGAGVVGAVERLTRRGHLGGVEPGAVTALAEPHQKLPRPIGDCNERLHPADAAVSTSGLSDAETKPATPQPDSAALAMRPHKTG